MKKVLLLAGVWALGGFFTLDAYTQCNFSNAGVKLNTTPYTDPATGKCMVNIDLYFDLESNAGGKYVYVHIWPTAVYPDYNYNSPPDNTVLANTVATIGFYHHSSTLAMLEQYAPYPGIPHYQFAGLSIDVGPGSVPGYDRFTVHNITIAAPSACTIPQSFTADAWESQSAQGQNVHCFSKGLVFYANDPIVTGFMRCDIPRQYVFQIRSINTSGITVNYKSYIDNGDGLFNKITDTLMVYSGTVNLNAANNYLFNSGYLDYLPYAETKPYADKDIWIEITSAALPNAVYAHIVNTCISLPVNLISFTAHRNREQVELKWTTSEEEMNKGFAIERLNGTNDWQTTGFVPSAAGENKTLSGVSDYSFTDYNNLKGVSQYRLRQVNLNNTFSYSDIRMVKGIDQQGKVIVFPNPVLNGQMTVVVENVDNADALLQLVDMNGRYVKTWTLYQRNHLSVAGVPAGVYTLKVTVRGSNETVCTRVVIE